MAFALYQLALQNPNTRKKWEDFDRRHPGLLDKCPECNSPMLRFSNNPRMGIIECICPDHGLILLEP